MKTAVALTIFLFYSTILGLWSQSWNEDKLQEYKMEKADIIIKAKYIDGYYMSGTSGYTYSVIEVIKGTCSLKEIGFEIEYGGATEEIRDRRLHAINSKDTVIIGFRKHKYLEGIVLNSVNYAFFMSQ